MITKNSSKSKNQNKNLSGQVLWYYQIRSYLPKEEGKYLIDCDFCAQKKIKVNKNFHLCNRNKAKFWNEDLSQAEKLICSSCLFETRELAIDAEKKETFKNYKFRYSKPQEKSHE